MPVPFYKCAKCGRTFDNYEDAEACEDGHLTVTSARVLSYTIRPYPYTVEVTFNNGEKRVYYSEDLGE